MRTIQRGLLLAINGTIIFLSVIAWSYGIAAAVEKTAARVEKVSDGDTMYALVNGRSEKIRLIGIDTPEIGQRPWGERSRKHLEKMLDLSSWNVIIECDVEDRDQYGRILAYAWTTKGKMINEEMLRSGYAVLYTFPPNVKYINELRAAQKEAREKKLGIWGKNGLKQRPYKYRKEHPRD